MNLGEGRRSGAWEMDFRISRLQSFRENRENMIEYTEELIQARDHRPISGLPENVSAIKTEETKSLISPISP